MFNGTDVNIKDAKEVSALQYAIKKKNSEILDYLISKKAKVQAQNLKEIKAAQKEISQQQTSGTTSDHSVEKSLAKEVGLPLIRQLF